MGADNGGSLVALLFLPRLQTATESPLASQYNDQAPLEHHHLAVAFQILRREGCDIVGHLEKAHRVSKVVFRATCVLILLRYSR